MTRILIDRIDSLWTLRLSQQHRTYFDGESPDPQSNWTRGTSLQCQLLSSGIWAVQFHNLQRALMDLVPPKPGPLHLTALCPERLQPVSIIASPSVLFTPAIWGFLKPWGIPGSLASGRSSGTLHGDLSGHPAWRFPKSQSTTKSPKIGCYQWENMGKPMVWGTLSRPNILGNL